MANTKTRRTNESQLGSQPERVRDEDGGEGTVDREVSTVGEYVLAYCRGNKKGMQQCRKEIKVGFRLGS